VLIFATLIVASGRSSGDRKVATIEDAPLTADVELSSAAPESAPMPRRTSAPARPEAPVLRTASLSYAPSVAPNVEAPPVPAAAVARVSTVEPVPEPRQPEPETTAAVATAVTISGCLERDDERFVLKNVSDEGAPTSRSWKSGFLRKRSTSIELIDPARTNRLASYVGRHIETSGVLEDREMHVKSLRVQGTCD